MINYFKKLIRNFRVQAKREVTFWLSPVNDDETNHLTILLESVPRVGELVVLDLRLESGERVTRSLRVWDVNRVIKWNPDAGPPIEKAIVFLER